MGLSYSSGLLTWLLLWAVSPATAVEYPEIYPRMRNEDLRGQLGADPGGRFTPFSGHEWVTAAGDGHLFYRSYQGDDPGYYHGGYWFNLFAELRPIPGVDINSRFIVYNPAYSYGAVSNTFLHPLLGLSWHPENTPGPEGIRWRFRAGDLDRQTIGAGLSLEDKEMGGLILEVARGDWRIRGLVDGTGGFMHAGDLNSIQVDWKEEVLGVSALRTGFAQRVYPSVYSKHALGEYLSYALESSWNRSFATFARVQFKRAWGNGVSVRLRAENRNFPAGFADGYFNGIESTRAREITGDLFPTAIEHDYLSIDQEDKPYSETQNLFVIGRNVMSSTALGDLQWEIFRRFSLVSVNEIAWIEWRGVLSHTTYLYRHGFRLALDESRSRFLDLYGSNKSSSASRPLSRSDLDNKSTFIDRPYIAFEGRLRF